MRLIAASRAVPKSGRERRGPDRRGRPATPPACGKCHIRGPPDKIPAQRGFIQHHEQYNEYMAGAHAGKVECATCHDPHKAAKVSVRKQCADCHEAAVRAFQGSTHQRANVRCSECHMPPAGLSAEPLAKYEGDVKTHIFRISLGPNDKMFTDDGKFATGKLTADFACLRCHGGQNMAWAVSNAKGIHTRGKP